MTTALRATLLLALGAAGAPGLVAQEIGTLTVQAGLAGSLRPSTGSVHPAVRLDLSFVTGRFSLGPEVAAYATGPDSLGAHEGRGENVVTLGAATRYQLRAADLRPYLTAGLGAYFWESSHPTAPTGTYLSGSVGAGVFRSLNAAGSGLGIEARLHQVLQHTGLSTTRRFATLTAGFTLGW